MGITRVYADLNFSCLAFDPINMMSNKRNYIVLH